MSSHLLDRKELLTLVASGSVKKCTLRPVANQWLITIQTPSKEYLVATKRQPKKPHGARQFKSLDTAAVYIFDVGLGRASIELAEWKPHQKHLFQKAP